MICHQAAAQLLAQVDEPPDQQGRADLRRTLSFAQL